MYIYDSGHFYLGCAWHFTDRSGLQDWRSLLARHVRSDTTIWLKATEGKTGAVAARGVLVVGCDYPLDPIGFWGLLVVWGWTPLGWKGLVPAFCGSPLTGVTLVAEPQRASWGSIWKPGFCNGEHSGDWLTRWSRGWQQQLLVVAPFVWSCQWQCKGVHWQGEIFGTGGTNQRQGHACS